MRTVRLTETGALSIALSLVMGCGGGTPASPDTGPARDTGPLPDTGPQPDTGPRPDTGVAPGDEHYFPAGAIWTTDVYDATPASDSTEQIAGLRAGGGWGNGDTFQIDFSIDVLTADAATPLRSFEPTGDFYDPDCDMQQVPIPAGGNIEGEDAYECTGDGDCHLIVWVPVMDRLYEMWRANIDASDTFYGGCLAVWDTSRVYGPNGRGLQCTSADAAGFPIAPLLFTADEVAAGEINHAIRFILPNDRVQRGFVPPATHGTNTTGGGTAPYYGVHFRLRRDYDVASLPSEGARVVARALQHYGMFHADGGNIALTAQSDRHSTAQWDGLLDPHDLAALAVEDFEVIDHGASMPVTFDCVREP